MINWKLAVLLVAITYPVSAGERLTEEGGEGQTEHDRQASSYLHAQMINADALKSFDVLIRYEAFHDVGPERYVRHKILWRLRVDFTANKLLAMKSVERRQLNKEVSAEESRQVLLLGGAATSERAFENRFDGKIRKVPVGMPDALEHLEMVDVRYVGLTSFPRAASTHSSFAETLAASKAVQGFQTLPAGSDRLKLYRETPIGNAIADWSYNEWTFDTSALVPTNYYDEIRREIDGKRVTYPICRESIEWKDADGVYVPIRIVGTEGKVELIDGKPIRYEVDKTVEFHWFSINDKFDDENFSEKLIESYDVAFPLIDEDLFETESVFQQKE